MIKRKYLRCLSLIFCALLPFSGCIRTAIPEYYSGLKTGGISSPANSGRVLRMVQKSKVVVLARQPREEEPDATLGHQFLFLFFPFTSLYFGNGPQAQMEELASEVLTEKGNLVIEMDEKDLEHLPRGPGSPEIYRVSVSHPRVNAYDVFFFRILDISGNITMRIERPAEVEEEVVQAIDGTTYRKYALGPRVAYQMQKAMRDTFAKMLADQEEKAVYLGPRRSLRTRLESTEASNNSQEIVVLRPKLLGTLPSGFGQFVADSFGYPNALSYSDEALLRIMQHGMRKGFSENLLGVEASNSETSSLLGYFSGVAGMQHPWVLASDVQIPLSEEALHAGPKELPVEAELTLSEFSAESFQTLSKFHCRAEVVIPWHKDGGVVLALEEGLSLISKKVLSADAEFRGDDEAGRVSCKTADEIDAAMESH